MKSFGANGYNCTKGGNGNLGRIWTDEQKERMSKNKKGISTGPCSEETKRKILEKNKGRGRKQSEETKRKISMNNAKANSKCIMFVNSGFYKGKEFYKGMIFNTVKECAEYFGINYTNMSAIKNGKYKYGIKMQLIEVNADS